MTLLIFVFIQSFVCFLIYLFIYLFIDINVLLQVTISKLWKHTRPYTKGFLKMWNVSVILNEV